MNNEEVISQSRFGRRTTFQFGEDKLSFSISDQSGQATGAAFYEAIDTENCSTVTVKAGQRYFWMALFFAVFLSIGFSNSEGLLKNYNAVPVFIFLGLAFFLRYGNVVSVPFTILPVQGATTSDRIRVIQDKNLDRILERIKSGRIARLRKLHLAVNTVNNPTAEANKFRWLLDQGVIDDAEYRRAISQIEALVQNSAPTQIRPEPGRTLN